MTVEILKSTWENDKQVQKVLVYADSSGDIPEPKAEWCAGSAVLIMDTQEVKFLNSKGEWV